MTNVRDVAAGHSALRYRVVSARMDDVRSLRREPFIRRGRRVLFSSATLLRRGGQETREMSHDPKSATVASRCDALDPKRSGTTRSISVVGTIVDSRYAVEH